MKRFLTVLAAAALMSLTYQVSQADIARHLCLPSIGCLTGDGTDAFFDANGDGDADIGETNITMNAPTNPDGDSTHQGNLNVVGTLGVTGAATVTGALSAASFTATPSATPTAAFRDSDNTDSEDNVRLFGNCVVNTSTAEDCTVTLDQYVDGGVKNTLSSIGDGAGVLGSDQNTGWTITSDGTGTAELALVAGAIDSTEILDATIVGGDLSATLALATTGTITGGVAVSAQSGTSDTLAGSEVYGTMMMYSNAGVVTVTLPAVAAGMNVCIYDTETTAIVTIDVDAADVIILNGAPLTAGNTIDSAGDAGDFVCLVGIDTTSWVTLGRSGTWIDGGAS